MKPCLFTSIVGASTFATATVLSRHDDFHPNALYRRMHGAMATFSYKQALQKFDQIAREHGGNRAFGTDGFNASLEEIQSRTNHSNVFTTMLQEFDGELRGFSERGLEIAYDALQNNAETKKEVIGPLNGTDTPPNGITAKLIFGHSDEIACNYEQYKNVEGKIVVQPLGKCKGDTSLYEQRVKAAASAGAVAVILYNDDPDLESAAKHHIYMPDTGNAMVVPIGFISRAHGRKIKRGLTSKDEYGEADATFWMRRAIVKQTGYNYFVDSNTGNETNMIVLGAHLDSLRTSPGINDNASGATLLLALFEALERSEIAFYNKIRLAWWGGGIDSQPSGAELYAKTSSVVPMVYLNFDMLADSREPNWGVLFGPSRAEVAISKLFKTYLTGHQGKRVTDVAVESVQDARISTFSDELGVPVGGLTSVVSDEDPCLGKQCDKYEEHDEMRLKAFTKAAAYVLSELVEGGREALL